MQSIKRVLVIEDDHAVQEAIADVIRTEGLEVDCVNNGLEGLQYLRRVDKLPDLILLDLLMPIQGGIEFRGEQKKDARFSEVPLVVMSAKRDTQHQSREIEADGYLQKPIELDSVYAVLKKFCS